MPGGWLTPLAATPLGDERDLAAQFLSSLPQLPLLRLVPVQKRQSTDPAVLARWVRSLQYQSEVRCSCPKQKMKERAGMWKVMS